MLASDLCVFICICRCAWRFLQLQVHVDVPGNGAACTLTWACAVDSVAYRDPEISIPLSKSKSTLYCHIEFRNYSVTAGGP